MKLFCIECGKPVSNELPEETIVRAVCICPECIEKQSAAEQPLAPDACPECGNEYSGACGSCAVGHERG